MFDLPLNQQLVLGVYFLVMLVGGIVVFGTKEDE